MYTGAAQLPVPHVRSSVALPVAGHLAVETSFWHVKAAPPHQSLFWLGSAGPHEASSM